MTKASIAVKRGKLGNVLATAALAALTGVTGCNWDLFGPVDWSADSGGGGCWYGCGAVSWANPWRASIVRGDTIRFLACSHHTHCRYGVDTGGVLTNWSVGDTTVAVLVGDGPTSMAKTKTSVLLRGMARGATSLRADFPTLGGDHSILVADSSDIKSVRLSLYGYQSDDAVRVGSVRTIQIQLRDAGGFVYRGTPAAYSASDTNVIRVTSVIGYDGQFLLQVTGVKPGKASLTATFHGLTATRELTVFR